MAPRSRCLVDQSPMAITSSGGIVVGLGYCYSAKTTQDVTKAIAAARLNPGQSWFVGVVLDNRGRADALHRLEDAAAEAAALSATKGTKGHGR